MFPANLLFLGIYGSNPTDSASGLSVPGRKLSLVFS